MCPMLTSLSGHWTCSIRVSSFGFFQVFGKLDKTAKRTDKHPLHKPLWLHPIKMHQAFAMYLDLNFV